MITAKCPKCNAQYELTEEQLSVANGKVRCGACMTVFQAVPPERLAKQEKPAAQPRSKPDRSSFVNDDDDQLLADTGIRESFGKGADIPTGEFNDINEELINDEPSSGGGGDHFSDEFDEVLGQEQGFGGAVDDDESWAEQLLEEHGGAVDEEEESAAREKNRDQPRTALGSHGDDGFDEDLDELGISLSLTPDEEEALGAFGKDNLRERITPEPLEFSLGRRRSLLINLALALLAVVAAAGVVGQWFYFQFDELARSPQWRDFYATACERLDCQLPDQYRLDEIRAGHLTVKSHPHFTDTLLVDLLVTNHADIAQPFPDLELFFTNMDQEVVAARRFSPEEYLRGELSSAGLMPQKQPIHLALELDDPGKSATGYRVELRY